MDMIRRLRLRLVIIMMSIITILLLLIFSTVLILSKHRMVQENLRMMRSVSAAPFDTAHSYHGTQPGVPREKRPFRLPFFRVSLNADETIAAIESNEFDLSDEALLHSIISSALAKNNRSLLPAYNLRFYIRELSDGGRILVFTDITSEKINLNNLLRLCLLVGLLSFLAFLALTFLFSGWAVRPISTAWQQQRQFVSDASHELKTPLTVILTNAELLKKEALPPVQQQRLIDNILEMSGQMRGLVESLLSLARLDNGILDNRTMENVDLSQLAETAELNFEVLFFERGLTLSTDIRDGIRVRGSAMHLKQLLDGLLDNALKYAEVPGTVCFRLGLTDGRHCRLSVSTPGVALSREDLENIFKRFYRIDNARTISHSYGLGLAIAQDIVRAHKGRLWAESEAGINTFIAEFPLADHANFSA